MTKISLNLLANDEVFKILWQSHFDCQIHLEVVTQNGHGTNPTNWYE